MVWGLGTGDGECLVIVCEHSGFHEPEFCRAFFVCPANEHVARNAYDVYLEPDSFEYGCHEEREFVTNSLLGLLAAQYFDRVVNLLAYAANAIVFYILDVPLLEHVEHGVQDAHGTF